MARKYRTHIEERKAVEFTLEIERLDEYKEAWLVINNNAREYPDSIYKVSNIADSDRIFVLCNPEELDNARSFLSQFGKIVSEDDEKVAVFVSVSCDYSDFDNDYIDSEYVFGELD